MILALREIMDEHQVFPLRIGVHRGSVFAGDIGPPYRRTFTVMGDAVNLTARLMAKAQPGQILSTPEVLERAGAEVEMVELEPFQVKGKVKPVRAVVVGRVARGWKAGSSNQFELVGREAEMDMLRNRLAAAERGEGALVEVTGEPGVGKSRLVEELRQIAGSTVQLGMSCEPYEASTPYYPFRRLLRDIFGIAAETTGSGVARHVRITIDRVAPGLSPWAPLLGMALDVPMPDSPETAQLQEQFRRPRLAHLVAELLGVMLGGPTLLTIEDAHWMDEASSAILGHLASFVDARPWLICVTRRLQDGGFRADPGQAVELRLTPLDQKDAAQLLQRAAEEAPLPPPEIGVLAERAGGNPLFLQELAAAARDVGDIDSLPDTIEAVIASRIDQLNPVDRNLLRRVSVLGRSFPIELARAVIGGLPGEDDAIWRRLGEFVEIDDGGTVRFVHALFRDSAYDGLPYSLRKELHARVGDTIRESMPGDDSSERAGLLSLHFFFAHRYQEAWEFSLAAAERAKAVYANLEAAELYQRALDSARQLPELDPLEVARVREALGDAFNNGGNFWAAAASYRATRRLVTDDPVVQARLFLKLAKVMGWLDRYAAALRWLTKGLRSIEDLPGTPAAAQRAQLLAWYGRFCQEEGHHARAIKWCQAALAEAETAGERDALANALKVLDWASMDLGRLVRPDNWDRALTLFEELGDLTGQASVLNLLGGHAYFRGRWDEALELYRRAQAIVRRTGNAVMEAFYLNNIGEIALEQGHLSEAEELFTDASRVWNAAGYRSGAASTKCNLGRVACGQGRYADALKLFEESLAESDKVGGQVEALDASARMAECLLLSGDADGAAALAELALERARVLGGVAAQTPLLYRVRGVALFKTGDVTSARAALDQSHEAGRTRGADYEVALTLDALADLDEHAGQAHNNLARLESQAILQRLGVIWTPDLLPFS
jgi:tetratricopeptide (TPR) repeat protein